MEQTDLLAEVQKALGRRKLPDGLWSHRVRMLESFERAAAAGLRAVGRHKRGTPGHQRAVLLTHDMLAEAKRHVLRADGKFQRWLMRTSRPRLSDLVEEFKTSARLVDLSASILDEHNAVEDAGGVRLVDEKIRRLFLSQRA